MITREQLGVLLSMAALILFICSALVFVFSVSPLAVVLLVAAVAVKFGALLFEEVSLT